MAGIDPQRKALIDVLNQKEQERLAKQPPPSPLSQALASVAQPFQSYFDRQGKLAREGWDQANMGAEQLRAGDLPMGAANALLGPVNWLTSPINALLPEEQATRDFGRSLGGSTGEALAASGLGLAAIAMPGPDVGKGAKFADEAAEGITAYHGSPHTFDKFSMDKIGTGEGAQAYGHGLYFAENENVAKSYRGAGSGAGSAAATLDGVPVSEIQNKKGALDWLDSYGSVTNTRAALKGRHPELLKELDDLVDTGRLKEGATYQVRLNVKPDELLDFDSPASADLAKKLGVDSGKVTLKDGMDLAGGGKLRVLHNGPDDSFKYKLEMGGKQYSMHPRDVQNLVGSGLEGKSLYQNLSTKLGGDLKATEALKAAGVKGIRYKDAGSRGAEGGTYNYVIFDDSLVSILKRYAIPFTLGAGGAAIVSGANMPPELAAQMEPQA